MNNWASPGGSGTTYTINGQSFDATSPQGMALAQKARTGIAANLSKSVGATLELADAEANNEASLYEQQENKEASNRAFEFAQTLATKRRTVGGSRPRGAVGGQSINSATGGLVAQNAAKRRTSLTRLARARVNADPAFQQQQTALQSIKGIAAKR